MQDEGAFQAALDAHPDDHNCRLVFADWLQERDDPRAEGYRALGVLRRVYNERQYMTWLRDWTRSYPWEPHTQDDREWADSWAMEKCAATLPRDWHELVGEWSRKFDFRQEAEDAAALAFAKLPAERRAELLK